MAAVGKAIIGGSSKARAMPLANARCTASDLLPTGQEQTGCHPRACSSAALLREKRDHFAAGFGHDHFLNPRGEE
jgi:hypothetical protein